MKNTPPNEGVNVDGTVVIRLLAKHCARRAVPSRSPGVRKDARALCEHESDP